MIKRMLLSMLLTLVLVGASYAQTNQPQQPPKPPPAKPDQTAYVSPYKGKMQLTGESFDFGRFPENSKVSHIFWLKNTGLDSLEIISVSPG